MKTLFLALLLVLSPVVASAQVLATIPILAQATHDAHDYSFGPVNLPEDAVLAHIDINPGKGKPGQLQPGETMVVVVQISLNGGMTFIPAGGANFDSINQPRDFDVTLPEPTNPARVLQGRFTILGNWRGNAAAEIE